MSKAEGAAVRAENPLRSESDGKEGRLRSELLGLMVPFPPSREELRENTLAAVELLRGLPDGEVAKLVTGDGGSFIAAVSDAEAMAKQAGPQPTAFD